MGVSKRKWVQGWNVGTPSYDGTFDFFEEWIERDVTDMVRRDRNHTCIFLWSIGNEVDYPNDPYSHPVLDGAKINQPMFGGYKPDAPRCHAHRNHSKASGCLCTCRGHFPSRDRSFGGCRDVERDGVSRCCGCGGV